MQYKAKIPYNFYDLISEEDIDCYILVQDYIKVKPDYNTWDSDSDYYGYEEFDYILVDEENNELNVDIDESLNEEIANRIRKYFEDESP